jgi:hypothetical protein
MNTSLRSCVSSAASQLGLTGVGGCSASSSSLALRGACLGSVPASVPAAMGERGAPACSHAPPAAARRWRTVLRRMPDARTAMMETTAILVKLYRPSPRNTDMEINTCTHSPC